MLSKITSEIKVFKFGYPSYGHYIFTLGFVVIFRIQKGPSSKKKSGNAALSYGTLLLRSFTDFLAHALKFERINQFFSLEILILQPILPPLGIATWGSRTPPPLHALVWTTNLPTLWSPRKCPQMFFRGRSKRPKFKTSGIIQLIALTSCHIKSASTLNMGANDHHSQAKRH
jgi:hypothetical protein